MAVTGDDGTPLGGSPHAGLAADVEDFGVGAITMRLTEQSQASIRRVSTSRMSPLRVSCRPPAIPCKAGISAMTLMWGFSPPTTGVSP